MNDGGFIGTSTAGIGNAGNVSIQAKTISLDGIDNNGLGSSITSDVRLEESIGNGGIVNITTDSLSLRNGAQIGVGTFGQGKGGILTIRAIDSITLSGTTEEGLRTGLFASALDNIGDGGDLKIFTNKLIVKDGATINVSNFPSFVFRPPGKGAAGNVEINARSVEVNNGTITAANANGIGGKLTLNTNTLNLNNGASISAFSTSDKGEGGNITLKVDDTLFMRNNSSISAKASAGANGGNINLDAPLIVAFANQNNNILANAIAGKGGNIKISTQGIFGLQNRPDNSLTNDIDASSDFNLDGEVSIATPDVNPSQGIVKSSENLVEPETTVAQACGSGSDLAERGNTFTISGRGGMPPSPTEPLESNTIRVSGDRKNPEAQEVKKSDLPQGVLRDRKPVSSDEIIPARGMMINAQGQVVLTRYPTPNSIDRPIPQSNYCSSSVTDKEQSDRYSIVYDDELSLKFDEILKRSIAKFSDF